MLGFGNNFRVLFLNAHNQCEKTQTHNRNHEHNWIATGSCSREAILMMPGAAAVSAKGLWADAKWDDQFLKVMQGFLLFRVSDWWWWNRNRIEYHLSREEQRAVTTKEPLRFRRISEWRSSYQWHYHQDWWQDTKRNDQQHQFHNWFQWFVDGHWLNHILSEFLIPTVPTNLESFKWRGFTFPVWKACGCPLRTLKSAGCCRILGQINPKHFHFSVSYTRVGKCPRIQNQHLKLSNGCYFAEFFKTPNQERNVAKRWCIPQILNRNMPSGQQGEAKARCVLGSDFTCNFFSVIAICVKVRISCSQQGTLTKGQKAKTSQCCMLLLVWWWQLVS